MSLTENQLKKMDENIARMEPETALALLERLLKREDLSPKQITDLKARIAELEDEVEKNKSASGDKDRDKEKKSDTKYSGPLSFLNNKE